MLQSTFHCPPADALHVAIIMDGNGRWATERGLPRTTGHGRGARAARRIVEAAPRLGIGTLTLFAFSSDNWQRPADEVRSLMELFEMFLRSQTARCRRRGVRLAFLGCRERLSAPLRRALCRAEAETARGEALLLRIALDYSSRDALLRAARACGRGGAIGREEFSRTLAGVPPGGPTPPDVDLLIRTGGEQRLSDFLLWEIAYAEILFTPIRWPDFGPPDLERALEEYRRRDRRFGRVPGAAAQTRAESSPTALWSRRTSSPSAASPTEQKAIRR